ncbi:MAG: hypothetical protein KDA24_18615 [Deltaproteobacteria bacterium]|nr:hypothetical protein [Deltaproteobacteria bacterium]
MPTLPSHPSSRAARVALCALAMVLLLPTLASAQPKVSVDAPLLPLARAGAYTPIQVNIATTDPLEGEVRVSFGNSETPVVRPYRVGRSSVRRVSVPVVMPNWVPELHVEVTRGRRTLATHTLPTVSGSGGVDELHVVAVGEEPLGLTLLRQVSNQPIVGHAGCTREDRDVRVETLLPTQLPSVWFAWTSVDLVVWRRPDPSTLTPEQQGALRDWVHSGGTLLVGVADGYRAWSTSSLGALSGVDFSPAEASAGATHAVLFASGAAQPEDAPALPRVGLTMRGATPRLFDGDQPFVADHAVGAGRVVTLGFDPGAGELRGMSGAFDREAFWRKLLGLFEDAGTSPLLAMAGPPHQRQPDPCVGGASDWNWTGETAREKRETWRTNLEAALSSFTRANPLPLGTVLLFGLIYLLLIGPIDFVITRRLGKPMLTWVTFPVFAIFFSIAAALVISFRKAGNTEVRCVEVVDVFDGHASMRGSGWCAMWSSRRQDVRIPVPRGAGVVVGSGGAGDDFLVRDEVEALAGATQVGLGYRASQWAVSTWHSAWVDRLDGGMTVRATGDGVVVAANESGLDLDEAWVVWGRSMWPLGPLPSGARAELKAPVAFDWGTITGTPDSPNVEFDDPDYHRTMNEHHRWDSSWAMLLDPHTGHVSRLPKPGASRAPFLVGRSKGGVAPPVPTNDSADVEAFAIVRAPQPNLSSEDLP